MAPPDVLPRGTVWNGEYGSDFRCPGDISTCDRKGGQGDTPLPPACVLCEQHTLLRADSVVRGVPSIHRSLPEGVVLAVGLQGQRCAQRGTRNILRSSEAASSLCHVQPTTISSQAADCAASIMVLGYSTFLHRPIHPARSARTRWCCVRCGCGKWPSELNLHKSVAVNDAPVARLSAQPAAAVRRGWGVRTPFKSCGWHSTGVASRILRKRSAGLWRSRKATAQ
nr:hypothetical protein CFP56_32514 [Quercus suber]